MLNYESKHAIFSDHVFPDDVENHEEIIISRGHIFLYG